jgi:PAS domain S-box-containing protein
MATIQLLLNDEQNRQLLAEALDSDHDVIEGAASADAFLDTEFDLCILDAAAFRAQQETLAAKKEQEEPAFLPYLLLLGEQDPNQATEAVWKQVDEIIDTPIERAALTNRVSNLLQRRDLSLELKRRQEFTEERFRTLFESTPDPIVVVTDDGVVTEVNDAFTSMFDVDRETVLDKHVSEISATPRESIERLLLRVDEASESDPSDAEETVEVQSAGGDTQVTELNVDVVEELGEATERIGIFRDVTGREEYQQQLERQVEQLERFASMISHDLRSPLTLAMAKTRLLRGKYDDEKLAELAAVLDRMEALIEDVLTLAKQGKAVGDTTPLELADVVDAAWETFDTPDEATLDVDSDLPIIDADEERLQALLENLFRNAVTHAGPDVTIVVGPLDDRHGFYVADDGPGIPSDQRETVFEYGHSTEEEGTGLGLAIVKEIAEAHGWTVSLGDSDLGGARFELAGHEVSEPSQTDLV